MRGSILSRPLRPPSRINDESIDAEFQKSVQREEARRLKYSVLDESMKKMHIAADKPDIETKLRLFAENKQVYQEHQHHVLQSEHAARQEEERLAQKLLEHEQEEVRKYTSEKQRKQEEAKRIMDENRRLAELRKQSHAETKEREHALERQNLSVLEAAYSQRRMR